MHRIERVFVAADATLDRLQLTWDLKEMEDILMAAEVKEPDHMATDKGDNASIAIQELDHFLLTKGGCKGTPLAYLT